MARRVDVGHARVSRRARPPHASRRHQLRQGAQRRVPQPTSIVVRALPHLHCSTPTVQVRQHLALLDGAHRVTRSSDQAHRTPPRLVARARRWHHDLRLHPAVGWRSGTTGAALRLIPMPPNAAESVYVREDFWHSSSTFSRPEHLRLQLHARATRIKLEPTSNESSDAQQHMLSVLRAAVSDPPQPNMTSPQPTSAL